MADRMMELAKQRADLMVQLAQLREVEVELHEVEADMARELKGDTSTTRQATRSVQQTPRRATVPVRNGPARPESRERDREPVRPAVVPAEGNGSRQPPLKEVVQNILGQNPEGMELRDIVREVTRMKEAGEYNTNAKSITAVVSQAINQLKQDNLIETSKSEANRNLYTLGAAV